MKETIMKKYETPLFEECSSDTLLIETCELTLGTKWCFGCTNCNCN